jgi:hypothetical protein
MQFAQTRKRGPKPSLLAKFAKDKNEQSFIFIGISNQQAIIIIHFRLPSHFSGNLHDITNRASIEAISANNINIYFLYFLSSSF